MLDFSSNTYDFSLMFSTPFKALHFAIILDYKQNCDCFLLNVVGYNVYHAVNNKGQPPLNNGRINTVGRLAPLLNIQRVRLSEKMCARQSQKGIWDTINTLFLTLLLSNRLLLLSFSTRKQKSTASSAILSNFFEER